MCQISSSQAPRSGSAGRADAAGAERPPHCSVEFYEKLGFKVAYGGGHSTFATLRSGDAFVNLLATPSYQGHWWGRAIFRVDNVDEHHRRLQAKGLEPESPRDAPWGEGFFHIVDPDGHEISFAELARVA